MNRRNLLVSSLAVPMLSGAHGQVIREDYNRVPFKLATLPEAELSFTENKIQQLSIGGTFEDGIKRYKIDDKVYDHPLTVAQYVMRLLNNYRYTGDETYLKYAEMNLDRVAENETIVNGNGYYPYAFDYRLMSGPDGTLKAPWVSGMAQAQVLQAYNRYTRFTGNDRYADFAKRVLLSFKEVE